MSQKTTVVIAWMSDRIAGWSSKGKKTPQATIWMNDVETADVEATIKGAVIYTVEDIMKTDGNSKARVFAYIDEKYPLERAKREIEGDKYDRAIELLRQKNNPQFLFDAWNNPSSHDAGCLFVYCGRDRWSYGCLTQVRHRDACAEAFQSEIETDNRIPQEPLNPNEGSRSEVKARFDEIMPTLEVFAEWQRKLDKVIIRE